MSSKMVLIQYIGKNASKTDNARSGSGRVWTHPGHAIPVAEREKFSYLAFPDVWREISEDDYAAQQTEATVDQLDPIKAALTKLSAEGLKQVRSMVADELDLRTAARQQEIAQAAPTAKQDVLLADVLSSGDHAALLAYNERVKTIAVAIRAMDLRDDDKARNGRPLPQAIRDEIGGDLPSEDEITAALELLGHHAPPLSEAEKIEEVLSERDRALSALSDLPNADRATLEQMAEAFRVVFRKNISDQALYDRLFQVLGDKVKQ